MDEDFRIPRTLDAPALFFIFEADSAIIFLVWAILGAVMGGIGLMFGIFVGWLSTRFYVRLKVEGGRGLIVKLLYWFTPSDWISKANPSHRREYIGR